MHIVGVDFTSAPRRAKPITVAHAQWQDGLLHIDGVVEYADWDSYERWLAQPGPWLGGFDLPFGLARELVVHLGWPQTWPGLISHCATLERAQLRAVFKAFCDARPVGNKFAHRATDGPAGSSPSMKWVNPPVAYMFHEGARRLLQAGVTVCGLHPGDPQRVALETYPGMVARGITRASYKSDDRSKQTSARREARRQIVDALMHGEHTYGVQVRMDSRMQRRLVDEGSADALDAVLCAVVAAWASGRRDYGLPRDMDPVEGWIAGAAQGELEQNGAAALPK